MIEKYFASMFRRLQFTFTEGAIFISCVDQKLFTLQAIHHFLSMINEEDERYRSQRGPRYGASLKPSVCMSFLLFSSNNKDSLDQGCQIQIPSGPKLSSEVKSRARLNIS